MSNESFQREIHEFEHSQIEVHPSDVPEPPPSEFQKLINLINTDDIDEPTLWQKYCRSCFKYYIPPVNSVKQCLDGENTVLNLSFYIPRTLGIQLVCATVLGPPLAELTEIDFSQSPFNESGCSPLCEFMEESRTLEKVNLNFCGIGLAGVEIIRRGIYYSESITHLCLSHCGLNDAAGAMVANALISNEVCQFVDLSYNDLSTKSGNELGNVLASNKTLVELELKWNRLYSEDDSIVPLLKGLAKNVCLKRLGIAWNALRGANFALAMENAVIKHRKLEEVDIGYNRLASLEVDSLIQIIQKSKYLKKLYLTGNPFTESDLQLILTAADSETNLVLLSLEDETVSTKCEEAANQATDKYPNLKIQFKDVQRINVPEVDFSAILMDRCKYLAMKPKNVKLQRNMGHFFAEKLRDEPAYCSQEKFVEFIKTFQAKLDDQLIGQIATNWLEKQGNSMAVNMDNMAKYYLQRHPYSLPEAIADSEKKEPAKQQVDKKKSKAKKKFKKK